MTTNIFIRVSPATRRAIKILAAQRGLTIGQVVALAVAALVQDRKGRKQ